METIIKTIEAEIEKCKWNVEYHSKQKHDYLTKQADLETELNSLKASLTVKNNFPLSS